MIGMRWRNKKGDQWIIDEVGNPKMSKQQARARGTELDGVETVFPIHSLSVD